MFNAIDLTSLFIFLPRLMRLLYAVFSRGSIFPVYFRKSPADVRTYAADCVQWSPEAAAGAAVGAAAGTVFPIVGTAAGTLIGTTVGFIGGLASGLLDP